MHWKLFADLAETAGTREVELDGGAVTAREALEALLAAHPELEERVLDDEGALRGDVNVLLNGESLHAGEGLETAVEDDDELALFPPVSGG